jgi:hypothetical protein
LDGADDVGEEDGRHVAFDNSPSVIEFHPSRMDPKITKMNKFQL